MTTIQQKAAQCKNWLQSHVLPLWAEQAFDSNTGVFAEGMLAPNQQYTDDLIRFRVQPRQLYVFAHATEMGLFDGKAIVEQAIAGFERFQDADNRFTFAVNKQLEITHPEINTYEHAFALLGYAWHYKTTQDTNSIALAEACYQLLNEQLGDTENGGFFSSTDDHSLRSQNPHMHMFEAMMTWYEVTGDQKWLTRAGKLYDLFSTRFLESNFLRELYAEDLNPTHALSENLDPGHHYEWIWLLSHYAKLAKIDVQFQINILLKFAQKFGHSPLGLVYDEVKDNGEEYRTTSRLWCQTELIKARVALYEMQPSAENSTALINAIDMTFKYYLDNAEPGLWIDQLDKSGTPLSTKSPASTLYHIFLAFSEVCRITEK